MTDLEIAARFALAALFALMAIVLLRDHRNSAVRVTAGLLAVAAFADQVTTPFGSRSGAIGAVFQAASISGALWLWLLAKALFDDGFCWRARYFAALAVLVACSLGAFFYTDGFRLVQPDSWLSIDRFKAALIPQQLMIFGLSALALYEAINDWRHDLVARRRRFRQVFVVGLTLLLVGVSFANFAQLGTERNAQVDAVFSLITLAVVVVAFSWLLRLPATMLAADDRFRLSHLCRMVTRSWRLSRG